MESEKPTLFQSLLPSTAVVVEASISAAQGDIFPEEMALLTRAVEKRRREFIAGRRCLRAAFSQLGLPERAILVGHMRCPEIPSGYSATITHSGDLCAAAAMPQGEFLAIGIDIESFAPLGSDLSSMILTPADSQMVEELATNSTLSAMHWAKLIFSAKEAFYKAYFQIVGEFLDFLEAEIKINPDQQSLELNLIAPPTHPKLKDQAFLGKYLLHNDYAYTAFCI